LGVVSLQSLWHAIEGQIPFFLGKCQVGAHSELMRLDEFTPRIGSLPVPSMAVM
jgi:hypothetical protein